MSSSATTSTETSHDPVAQYATTVHGLHEKLGRVFSHHKDIADNLSRAAAALRSLSEATEPE